MGVWIARLTKGRAMRDTPNISRDQSGIIGSPDRSKLYATPGNMTPDDSRGNMFNRFGDIDSKYD
jgi:hypothetical protein